MQILLALLAKNGRLVHYLDVKTTFLDGDLEEEEVYVTQPEGFENSDQQKKVYKLHKHSMDYVKHLDNVTQD